MLLFGLGLLLLVVGIGASYRAIRGGDGASTELTPSPAEFPNSRSFRIGMGFVLLGSVLLTAWVLGV
jgi:hypothetical protein